MSEQSEFHLKAAAAIYLQGVLTARLKLDPDTTTAKQVEGAVIAALKHQQLLLQSRTLEALKELRSSWAAQLGIHANAPMFCQIADHAIRDIEDCAKIPSDH